jgi:predicted phage terminase large subunit-like protein
LIGKHENTYYIKELVHERGNPDQIEKIIKQTAETDGYSVVQWFEQEPGSSGKFVINNLAKTVLPRHRVKGFKPSGPKEAYADVAANRAENGRVKIVGNHDSPPKWVREMLAELQGFPKWPHDDITDALSRGIAAHERKTGWGVVSSERAA